MEEALHARGGPGGGPACESEFTPVDDSNDDSNTSQDEGSAAAHKAGATHGEKARRFVDTEAGRSSGSEADDDADDDSSAVQLSS